MVYKAKVAVCSEIRTKLSKQSEHHVQFLNVEKPLGFERLTLTQNINLQIFSALAYFINNLQIPQTQLS